MINIIYVKGLNGMRNRKKWICLIIICTLIIMSICVIYPPLKLSGILKYRDSEQDMKNLFYQNERTFENVLSVLAKFDGDCQIVFYNNEDVFQITTYQIDGSPNIREVPYDALTEPFLELKNFGFESISKYNNSYIDFCHWSTLDDSMGIYYSFNGEEMEYYTKIINIRNNKWFYYEHMG